MSSISSASAWPLLGLALALGAGPAAAQQGRPAPAPKPAAKAPAAAAATTPAAPQDADDAGRFFKVVPEKPGAGQPFTISYQPAGSPLAGKANVQGRAYYFDPANLAWHGQDVALKKGTAGQLTATLTPPPYAGFVAFRFVAADGTIDAHAGHGLLSGYLLMLRNPADLSKMAPGSYLGYGLLRSPKLGIGYGIPGYFPADFTISPEASFLWLRNELHDHPAEAPALMPQFLAAAKLMQGDRFPAFARAALRQASSQPNLTENDLMGLANAQRDFGRRAASDSLNEVMRARFPQGYAAQLAAFRTAESVAEPKEKLDALLAFIKAYPPQPAYQPPALFTKSFQVYQRAYSNIVLLNMLFRNYDILDEYAAKLSYGDLLNVHYRGIQNGLRAKDIQPDKALKCSAQLIQEMDARRAQVPGEFSYLTPTEWNQHVDQTSNSSRVSHVKQLLALGKFDEARPYAEQAQKVAQFQDADLNEAQATLLHHDGAPMHGQLVTLLQASVHANQASPQMLTWLKEDYVASHPGGAGYDQYLAGLKDQKEQAASRAEIAATILKKPIADFTLLDLNGKRVSLAAQKGKVVVLDFWANWCAPCKASFPGMQLAQERFKNDPNVVFYFIDTEEFKPGYQVLARKFITDNGFPFQVLFDETGADGKNTDAVFGRYAKEYKVSGIPQKFIIDPKGNLRFISGGYKGSPTGLADEIATMIELARSTQ